MTPVLRPPRSRVAVAATGEQALAAGLGVAADGGNAVDAALAAAFVSLATEPGMVSFGGGAYVAVWPADKGPTVIDGNVAMPGRDGDPARRGHGLRDVFTAYGGGVTMQAGAGSVATPGLVPALGVAHERHARLGWDRLLSPAVSAARDGYPMSPAAARYLVYTADNLFADDAEAHRLVTRPDGRVLDPGEPARNPLLADVLTQLGRDGSELFTTGAVGRALVDAMTAGGGLITAADLATYEPLERAAYQRDIGEWRIGLNPAPSIGGVTLAVMLGELGRRGDWSWSDAIEVQLAVLGYRRSVHDLSPDLEADGLRLLAAVDEYGLSALRGSSSTAHVSAVDGDGNACAITMSSGYGAGLCIPGTGILLNNCLGEMELNRRGLHALEPGTRLASNMAPTVGRAADGRALAIGSPGADRITTALMLVLGQALLHEADLADAIAAPRVHIRIGETEPTVEYEQDTALAAAVAATGLPSVTYDERHMYFGGVGAALLRADNELLAAGDLRREAAVGVID